MDRDDKLVIPGVFNAREGGDSDTEIVLVTMEWENVIKVVCSFSSNNQYVYKCNAS